MFKILKYFTNLTSFWIVCYVLLLWQSTGSESVFVPKNYTQTAENFSISSEVILIHERLSNLWITTRDKVQRKSTLPSNHRYGLQFKIQNNNIHLVLLCILLAGDIATNPGPVPTPTMQLPIKCATINARSLKSIHKDVAQGRREGGGYPRLLPRGPGQKGARTQTVTNLQVLQDMK